MSHTKGPWGAKLIEGKYRVYPSGERFGMTFATVFTGDNGEANAHLIAAAPDLLAELKHLVALMEPDEESGNLHIRGLATLNGARAAIAKATGGQNG